MSAGPPAVDLPSTLRATPDISTASGPPHLTTAYPNHAQDSQPRSASQAIDSSHNASPDLSLDFSEISEGLARLHITARPETTAATPSGAATTIKTGPSFPSPPSPNPSETASLSIPPSATIAATTSSSQEIDALASRPDQQRAKLVRSDSAASSTASARPPSRPSPSSAGRSHQPPASAIRKTSPGLAARLKALGFGSSTPESDSATPNQLLPERIGRLDENQLRQLDRKHQAGSAPSIISKRGRPWKGAGIFSSRSASRGDKSPDASNRTAPDSDPVPLLQLPEIRTPEPLAMDTRKYRLPDHTNGNGTKSVPDIRREHLERCADPPSPEDASPPPPPPKETPPAANPPSTPPSSDYVPGLSSYFTPNHGRPGSIYTLSRASFANQLAQLTSLQLPDAESLSSKISAIPTASVASKALSNAAEQIRSWIAKAMEVIGGLDSEDDVEWAAAGGREGLAEVENAIARFEELINVFVGAIEELQSRPDIGDVSADDLNRAVLQMESIIQEWSKIRRTLHNVRAQVEIAMEWEELWNNVLGDIGGEVDELGRLVFEMEERRHQSIAAAAGSDGVDIGDLETIVEDPPAHAGRLQAPGRLGLPAFPMAPSSPTSGTLSQDDSSLLALFARMQPLRASLDFLPMRLSVFEARAELSFPTACEELEDRRAGLDASYKKLEQDAEVLRKELGEDRWVIVFRGAGRQAQKMHESVERSMMKVKEAIDAGLQVTNPPVVTKKMESYEAKRTHYGPAIERVLSIIDKGVQDRLTVNGEILRLHIDLQSRWEILKVQIHEMDSVMEEFQAERKSQHLRDSVSSMLSNDRSTTGSGHDTPGSSPPSSVIMSSLGFEPRTPAMKQTRSLSTNSNATQGAGRRLSSLPTPKTGTGASRLSTLAGSTATTPRPGSRIQRSGSTLDARPKWNSSVNAAGVDTGHNFRPTSLTTPSPYRKRTPNTVRSASSLTPGSSNGNKPPAFRSPLGRAVSESPRVDDSPIQTGHSRFSFRERLASPGPYSQQSLSKPRLPATASNLSTDRRASLQPSRTGSAAGQHHPGRPASSLAASLRGSLLPKPGNAADPKDSRPKWRP